MAATRRPAPSPAERRRLAKALGRDLCDSHDGCLREPGHKGRHRFNLNATETAHLAGRKKAPAAPEPPTLGLVPNIGRPIALTREVAEAILEALAEGAPQAMAASEAGIGEATFYNWTARGRQARAVVEGGGTPDPSEVIFLEFLSAVEQARGRAGRDFVKALRQSALGLGLASRTTVEYEDGSTVTTETFTPPSVQAQKFYLERSWRKDFGPQVAVTGPDGGPVDVTVTARDTIAAKLAELADRLAPPDQAAS